MCLLESFSGVEVAVGLNKLIDEVEEVLFRE